MKRTVWMLWVLLFWGWVAKGTELSESFIPSTAHATLLRNRMDCSIYAAVKVRTQQKYQDLLIAYKGLKKFAKQRREALVLCGAPSEDSRRALQEEDLADRCPTEYQSWLGAGERYFTHRMELNEAHRNLQSLVTLIAYHCGKVPEVPEKLPPEPEAQPPSEVSPAENPN